MIKTLSTRNRSIFILLFILAVLIAATPILAKAPVSESKLQLPLYFERNEGQFSEPIAFAARGTGYTILAEPTNVSFILQKPPVEGLPGAQTGFQMWPLNANQESEITGLDRQPGVVNYLIGSNDQHHTGIATYRRVKYSELWPGIDLELYGTDQLHLEYDLVLAPGADPTLIMWRFTEVDHLAIETDGSLTLYLPDGETIQQSSPLIYQPVAGQRRPVEGGFTLVDETAVAFWLGDYDPTWPLVIDPAVAYSTYLGGSNIDDALTVTADSTGSAYFAGYSTGGFPVTAGSYRTSMLGSADVVVTKIAPDGASLVYSTYFGGYGDDFASAIVVTDQQFVLLAGSTTSNSNLATSGTYDQSYNGGTDGFIAALSNDGSYVARSTYLGGSSYDTITAIGVDSSWNVYVTGYTNSNNFPTYNAYLGYSGNYDIFVTKIAPLLNNFSFSTYMGGLNSEYANSLAVDNNGGVFIVGKAASGFLTSANAYDRIFNGNDGFVLKFSSAGTLVYSTLLGPVDLTYTTVTDVAVDSNGYAVVVGQTEGPNFPTTAGAYDRTFNGSSGYGDGFVTKFNLL